MINYDYICVYRIIWHIYEPPLFIDSGAGQGPATNLFMVILNQGL